MPEYLSPGVYIEEIEGPQPIEGVSTSTTGAVGVTARGPVTGKPVLVTSFSEFQRTFGGFLDAPPSAIYDKWADKQNPEGAKWWLFPLSVKGFFDNGGQRLYVKRVFSSKAQPSGLDLAQGVVAEVDRDVPATSSTVRLRHLLGVGVTVNGAASPLTLWRDGQSLGQFTVKSYDASTREVTLDKQVGQSLKSGRDYFVVQAVNKQPANATLSLRARSPGAWGDEIQVRARPMVGGTFNLKFSAALNDPQASHKITQTTFPYTWKITVDDATGFALNDHVFMAGGEYIIASAPAANAFEIKPADPTVQYSTAVATNAALAAGTPIAKSGGPSHKFASGTVTAGDWTITLDDVTNFANGEHVQIDGDEYVLSNGAGMAFVIQPASPGGPIGMLFSAGTTVRRLRRANNPGNDDTLAASGASGLYPDALVELDNGQDKEILTVDSLPGGDAVKFASKPAKQYYEGARLRLIEAEISASYESTSETVSNLRLTNGGQDLIDELNKKSTLLTALAAGPGFGDVFAQFPITPDVGWDNLSGGDDALGDLAPEDFVGVDGGSGHRTGIQALEDIEEIAIVTVPNVWSSAVHGALIDQCETLRYRFAILDPADGMSIEEIQGFREGYDTKYAALYYPWLVVRDPGTQSDMHVAPSGHMAGIYARVDDERGVHKAPANEVIRGINLLPRQGLADDINKREQDVLNPVAINALRFFPDRGHRVWGARVLTSLAEWKYINVRRLFIFLEHSIDKGTQWVVFEPNDEPLWARVRQSVGNFLETVWRSGALQGTKPDEAFFVRVDRTTMSQDDLDNGRLIVLVGVAPVKPAEFVIFRIQQKTIDQKAP